MVRRCSWFFALGSVTVALAAAGCGDNLGPAGGAGSDADAGPGDDEGGQPGGGMSSIITCPEAVPAASEGSCDVTAGDGTAVLLRGTVLGRDVVYENGAVLYDGTEIVCTGCDCGEMEAAADATRV